MQIISYNDNNFSGGNLWLTATTNNLLLDPELQCRNYNDRGA